MKDPDNWLGLLITGGFTLMGLKLLFIAWRHWRLGRNATKTVAVVVEFFAPRQTAFWTKLSELDDSSQQGFPNIPILSFRTTADREVRTKPPWSQRRFQMGETISILYDPNAPEDIVLAEDMQAGRMVFLFVLSTGFLMGGALLFFAFLGDMLSGLR